MDTWVYGIIGAGSVIILACLLFILLQIIGMLCQRVHKPILPFPMWPFSCTKVEESSECKESAKGGVCSFTYQEIELFSEGFSNLVGKGSINHVYKGILPNGTEVAVKRQKNMVVNQLDIAQRFHCQIKVHADIVQLELQHLMELIEHCGSAPCTTSRVPPEEEAPRGRSRERPQSRHSQSRGAQSQPRSAPTSARPQFGRFCPRPASKAGTWISAPTAIAYGRQQSGWDIDKVVLDT